MNQSDARQYFIKTVELSQETQFFLSSDLNAKIIGDLARQYKIEAAMLNDAVADIICADFDFSELESYLAELFGLDEKTIELLAIDLIGRFFLPLEKYDGQIKASEALKKRRADIKNFSAWQEAVDALLLAEADKSLAVIDEAIENIDWQEEKNIALEILNGSELVEMLKGNEMPEDMMRFNAALIAVLSNEQKNTADEQKALLSNDVVLTIEQKATLSNENLLTGGKITVNNQPASPTVSNWLKDYIDVAGGDKLDTLALTRYVSSSANAKSLSAKERAAVTNLLQLFFNIKFFPESMAGLPMEDWRLFHFGDLEKTETKAPKKRSAEPQQAEAAPIDKTAISEMTMEQKLAQYDWHKVVGIERRALLEELGVSLKDFVKWSEGRKL